MRQGWINRIGLVLCIGLSCNVASAQSLSELLAKHHIRPPVEGLPHLGDRITSYRVLDDARTFCVGYYLRQWDREGGPTLGDVNVCLCEKASGQWRTRSFNPERYDFRNGSILEVHITPDFVLLNLHHAHDLVLTRDLAFHDTIPALEPLGSFKDDTVVYQEYQPQFAPTHYASIYLYFPRSRQHRQVYPMKPYQAVRLRHLARVQAEYERRGRDWFAQHNHHMDPDRCDSFVSGSVSINDATDSMAFIVGFCNAEAWSPGQRHLPEPDYTKAVYVYKNVRAEEETAYREMPMENVQKPDGTVALEELLTAERLAELFSDRISP